MTEQEARAIAAELAMHPAFFPATWSNDQRVEYCRAISYRRMQMRGQVPMISPFHTKGGRQ